MSNSTAATENPPSVNGAFLRLWGVQYISYTLDVSLWSVAVVHTSSIDPSPLHISPSQLVVFQYFRKYSRKDPLLIRTTVAILLTVTTIHTLFLSIQDFKDFVLLFGNFEGQDVMFWESDVMICATFVVAFVAQMFYASRIWILKRDWRYITPVVFLALLQLSFGIAQTVEIVKVHRYSKLATTVATSTAQGAATAACDITITAILCYIFRTARTGVRSTDSTLDKMILYAFERGAMTSLLALLQLIFFITMPGTFFFTLFLLPSSHVYVISVCGMLTSREALRAQLRSRDGIIGMTSMATNSVNPAASDNLGVHVTKSVINVNAVGEKRHSITCSEIL
ncbi:hypothetical protein DFH06DRAFT_1405982 [Mycena polygramma]|nr:hypothetical protein DFH06DRAFT_1405982 [Mycena polygramma]